MTTPLRDRLQASFTGTYELQNELSGGGMSSVFLANDVALGRQVVVKVLPPEMSGAMNADRFRREVQIAARLQHAHIVPVLSAGDAEGLLYYTMPFVEGETLRARLARNAPMPVNEAIGILEDVLTALSYAHKRSVVHRDIKPENILLSEHDALVADFGIAKALAASATTAKPGMLTSAGVAIGTPAYMSPEQAAADPTVDQRADLYALGVIAYEMLSGAHPFEGRTPQAMLAAHCIEQPKPLTDRNANLHPGLTQLVMQLLEKAPERRPGSADEVLEILRIAQTVGSNWTSIQPAQQRKSIAVLPFVNIGADAESEYFSDGITEELLNALAKLQDLRVTARTSSFAFKGKSLDAREIGATLGVGNVIEGSVRRAGNKLRVTAQLVDCVNGYQMWSDSYDRQMDDVFAVQDDITRSIVGALRVKLEQSPDRTFVKRATTDMIAYDLYLKGRFAGNQRTGAAITEAVRCLEQAVVRDPNFAAAHAALVDVYVLLPLYTGASPKEVWPKAKAAGAAALRLDPSLAEAHTSLAYGTMLNEWDWEAAEAGFKRAIAANPDYHTAHHWYGDFLAGQGRLEESLVEMQKARDLDPLSLIAATELGWVLYLLHRTDEAMAIVSQIPALDPHYSHAHFIIGLVHMQAGNLGAAIASLERALSLGGFYACAYGALVFAYGVSGNREAANRMLDDLRARSLREYVPPFAVALSVLGLGDTTETFSLLNRAVDEKDVLLAENFFDPLFDILRSDDRYPVLLQRMGISPTLL
jgi:serine/threonine protein kinase/Tfp pilus assembly protein PilF